MKIIKVKIQKMGREEFYEFLKQIAAIIKKYDANKLKVPSALKNLSDSFVDLQAALDKEKSNLLTKTLNDLDHKRDVLISAFVKWLEAMVEFPDAAIATNATTLLHYVSGFGKGIAEQNYLAETTILTNIVDGFTKDASRSAALAAINGTPWITAIDAGNKEFAAQYANRIGDDASNNNVKSFSTYRVASTGFYNGLIELLTSRYNGDKADGADVSLYETCIGELNELIGKANVLIEASKPNPPKKGEKIDDASKA